MTYSTQPPRRKNNNAGCWLTGLVTMALVFILVLVGLFLPPFDLYNRLFTEPFVMFTQQGDSLSSGDGAFQVVAAADFANTDFGVRVQATSQTAQDAMLAVAQGALPPELALQSPFYVIETNRPTPAALILSMTLPVTVSADVVDLYGWYPRDKADPTVGGQWRFLAAEIKGNRLESVTDDLPYAAALVQTAPATPVVMVMYDVNQDLTPAVAQVATIIAPAGLQPTLTGEVTGSLAPGFTNNAPYLVMPVLRDYSDPRAIDTQTVAAVIGNSALRRTHVESITALVAGNQFDGIVIDYRGISADQRDHFSAFIRELYTSLHEYGLLLGVVVPAAENVDGVWNTGAYDWRAIGANSDYVQINTPINPRSFTPGNAQYMEALLRWTKGEISRYKVLLGLSAQSVREFGGTFTPIGYDAALAGLGDVKIEAADFSDTGSIEPGTELRLSLDGLKANNGIESSINTPYLDYLNADNSVAGRVWLTTGDALRFRMDTTFPFAMGGIGFEDLLSRDLADNLLEAVQAYQNGIPAAPAPVELVLRWQIEGTDGVLGEATTKINDTLVVTIAAPDGNYAINVVVAGAGQEIESPRTGAQVAQFRPTATPTPLPTATPTPIPTATPTLAASIPTNAPANTGGGGAPAQPSGGGFTAQRPSAGSIALGSFEYGGHVTGTGSGRAIDAARRAGMTWMKVQVRYYPGNSSGGVADEIATGHANGFKVLVGTVGSPNDLRAGGDGYIQQYAQWLAGIAGAGADAIEVWNEPNIDREWPEGQISGTAYTNMLRVAYQAIKSANGGTMVISGAPAPTGAEAAYPGKVVNDNRFLQEMVTAGALNYMDCVGLHYNEGIVPPNQQNGDPRDPYYTRYFWGMINTYSSITGNQRPLCITELGYLTPEGFPPLDPYFSWASNVTLAQQAAWLAEAAALSSQSGKVRLMIVWNVDFTRYDSDPQGGYAIVRPNGGCPACDALAGAR